MARKPKPKPEPGVEPPKKWKPARIEGVWLSTDGELITLRLEASWSGEYGSHEQRSVDVILPAQVRW